ncbi:hypothetical protein [Halobellus rufus]|uniref:hypothetical protein n=1 Tax=Halobellus rufus TaxID=1448860 RepID=UPI0018CEC3D9|nr:hypothetical protein [Halobellus rufus]
MSSGITLELLGVVAAIATLAVLILRGTSLRSERFEHVLRAVWPDVWRLRRRVVPLIERAYPPLFAVGWATREQLVGVVDASPAAVRRELRAQPDVYPGTLASLQYLRHDGKRVFEVGSYARRPDGLFGKWQTHVRVFPVPGEPGKSRIAAHHEYNPWYAPVRHYRAVEFDVERGAAEARRMLDRFKWIAAASVP